MALTITHNSTNAIPDWTQADLDAQIALGNFPPGTTLSQITKPSNWNANHTIAGSVAWGEITGTLSNQTDLQTALNAKQGTITLTTTGTSGAATLVANTLNIPNYATGAAPSFTDITTGSNTTAAMTVGSGASLTYSGTGTVTATHAAIANEASDTTCFINFVTTATGDQALKSNTGLIYNSSTNVIGATTFLGNLQGSVTAAASVTGGSALAIRTGTGAGNTMTLQARDVDGASYTTFMTFTANNTPTADLSTAVTVGGNANYYATGTDVALADGGTGASLADPNADRIMFWDDSAGAVDWLTAGTGLTITGTTLSATGGGSPAFSDITSATNTTAAMVVGTGASLGVSGSGTITATSVVAVDAGGDTTTFPMLAGAATGSTGPLTDAGLTYNATTNALTTTTFIGALTGNADTATAVAVGGITGLGAGVATFLATPSSANLATAVTDETGSGALVFANTPTLVTPVLGAATGTSLNLSGLTASSAVATDGSKNLVSVTNTGTGNNVLATSPTLVTPALGTPSALVGTNITGTAAGLTAGNVTTNANLTGPITSTGNATAIASQTGTGTKFVVDTSPTLVTPNIGVATGTSLDVSGVLEAGTNSGTNGQLKLFGSTSGDVTLKATAAAGTATVFQLPNTNGTNGYVLQTNGSGVTSWAAASGSSYAPHKQLFTSPGDFTPGSTTTLTLTDSPIAAAAIDLQIFFDGVQQFSSQWSYNGGTGVITFTAAIPLNVAAVECYWGAALGSVGTVTSVSVVSANGFAGSVATATSTPAITLTTSITGVLKGNGTAISAATAGTDYVTPTGTETLTNKRITKRIVAVNAPGATPTTNTDNCDIAAFTGLATAITSMTTNLSGTPAAGDMIMFQFTDNGTARGITWGASFAATTVALPTTTVISTLLRVGFQRNTANNAWDCVAVA